MRGCENSRAFGQEASTISWRIHVRKPSTNVLTPLKLGALGEVARDNIMVTIMYNITPKLINLCIYVHKDRENLGLLLITANN